jgi:hypothetical protein
VRLDDAGVSVRAAGEDDERREPLVVTVSDQLGRCRQPGSEDDVRRGFCRRGLDVEVGGDPLCLSGAGELFGRRGHGLTLRRGDAPSRPGWWRPARRCHVVFVEVSCLRRVPKAPGERPIEFACKDDDRPDGPGGCQRHASRAVGFVELPESRQRERQAEVCQGEPRGVLARTVATADPVVRGDHLARDRLSLLEPATSPVDRHQAGPASPTPAPQPQSPTQRTPTSPRPSTGTSPQRSTGTAQAAARAVLCHPIRPTPSR